MWTFLGIATFTYLYKKCGDVVSLANKELLLCALLSLSLGLALSYRYRRRPRPGALLGRLHSGPHVAALAHALAALPLIGFLWAQPPAAAGRAEQPGSKRVGGLGARARALRPIPAVLSPHSLALGPHLATLSALRSGSRLPLGREPLGAPRDEPRPAPRQAAAPSRRAVPFSARLCWDPCGETACACMT